MNRRVWLLLIALLAWVLVQQHSYAQNDAKTLRVVPHSNLTILDPDLDHGLHHAQPRLHDLRHAVRHGCQGQHPAADGGQVRHQQGQARPGPSRCATGWSSTTASRSRARTSSRRSQRWGKRDTMGQRLMSFVESMEAVNPKTFRMKLKEPYGLVLESLGKPSSNVPSSCPSAWPTLPQTSRSTTTPVPGPFIFKKDEWKPGEKVVYVKNAKYKPRSEPASGTAGGKMAKVDRVEWVIIKDPQTQAQRAGRGRDRLDRSAGVRAVSRAQGQS